LVTIVPGGLDDPRVRDLLEYHVKTSRDATAVESAHALDLEGLKSQDVTFWSAWHGTDLVGVGALKCLSATHGELKSMHTAHASRRLGVGTAMLRHIVDAARSRPEQRRTSRLPARFTATKVSSSAPPSDNTSRILIASS
jgi:putative acetyltransferase